MSRRPFSRAAPACAVVLLVLGPGCGGGKTYPVDGQVTFDGQPLVARSAVVVLVPDRARGNATADEPGGTVDSSGRYSVYTKGRRGAPPGWYKVVVTAIGDAGPPPKGPLTHRPTAKSLVPARYGQAGTTDLEIEVVPSPEAGAYDLKLKR
ncbi:MAG TPA: hypothetical protein VKD90_02175 [Gemmataceae bacterium]|nr:hypothetical protein [Gemmataceae bacterium]